MPLAIVVIPVYKPQLDYLEEISLKQCVAVLGRYPIAFVCPQSLDTSQYTAYAPTARLERFDDNYFKDIAGYNNLMLSKHFYSRFKKYEFMLIYQLDAFVFRDELEYWCKQGYDYIGAPWFEGFDDPNSFTYIGNGNGGFSLRRISFFMSIWSMRNSWKIRLPMSELYNRFKKNTTNAGLKLKISGFYFMLKQYVGFENNTVYFLNTKSYQQEDLLWVFYISRYFSSMRLASFDEASKFSFEFHAPYLYRKNGKQLPFGCHAWPRYHSIFWKQFVNLNNHLM
jgi:hypothetical protein